MRIWSLHPAYLDSTGLVALWREALLAKKVLSGQTKGYKNHPQLIRFKNSERPPDAINHYLSEVYKEALCRNYNFDKRKTDWNFSPVQLQVSNKQLEYEMQHLKNKLQIRDYKKYLVLISVSEVLPHPMFMVYTGAMEEWEIISDKHV